jgi:uncharacterized membrane protein YccC
MGEEYQSDAIQEQQKGTAKRTKRVYNPLLERVLVALFLTIACILLDVFTWPVPMPFILFQVLTVVLFTYRPELLTESIR